MNPDAQNLVGFQPDCQGRWSECFSQHHDFVVCCDAILLQRARMILAKKKGLERDLLLSESVAVACISDSFSANLDEF